MKSKSNKTIVLECYRKIIRDLDSSLIDNYIHDPYIQHSPTVKDGKIGLTEMLSFLKTLPKPAELMPSPIVRVVAESDFVAVHLDIRLMGKRWAVVDLYRLVNGKLAEHWDAGQEQLPVQKGEFTMVNGSTMIEDTADSQANKSLIADLYKGIFTVNEHLTPGFTEHDLTSELQPVFLDTSKIHTTIGEGNFVVVHNEQTEDSQIFARFDIFKFEDRKIAEHWSVKQQVPELMAHGNGMF